MAAVLMPPWAGELTGELAGVLAAVVVAGIAWRAGSLSATGAVAAAVVGGVAMSAGWPWGAYLVLWFVAASLLSRVGRATKGARTAGMVEKGDRRDAGQVLANGGVFLAAAVAALAWPTWAPEAAMAGAGALAAAGADTAATEVGTLWGGTPWSLRTRARALPGSSGAVSVAGTAGMLAAALLLGGLAAALRLVPWSHAAVVAYAAVCGAMADTMVGAWWQQRRWCPACGRATEQRTHRCGATTVPAGGWGWLSNDLVNLGCAATGAAVALALR